MTCQTASAKPSIAVMLGEPYVYNQWQKTLNKGSNHRKVEEQGKQRTATIPYCFWLLNNELAKSIEELTVPTVQHVEGFAHFKGRSSILGLL